MAEEFIELNRSYRSIEYRIESPKMLSELLLDDSCNIIVIIGDKGSGKTTELKQFYCKNKNNTVWGHLNDVVNAKDRFQDQIFRLFSGDVASYNILLDSIDECRMLDNAQDAFKVALDNLCEVLGKFPEKLKYTKILFTCRGSDWRGNLGWYTEKQYEGDLDAKLINESFNNLFVPENEANSVDDKQNFVPKIKIFHLEDLSEEQKKIIAKNYGLNGKSLTNNLFNQFTNTPLECIQLVVFLKQHSITNYDMDEFFLYQLRYRYRELNNHRTSNMPIKLIEKMAKRLAVSTLFKQTLSISKKESYGSFATQDSVSVLELFPEEDHQTIKDFISSTIFSSNGLNRVKFWNETARDYLAYLWLKERIANGKYRDVVQHLFINGHPKEQFIPALIALSNSEPKIHKLLIKNHPEAFIINSHLCPNLPSRDKENIINDILQKYEHRIRWMSGWGQRLFVANFANNIGVDFLLHKLNHIDKSLEDKRLFVLELMNGIQPQNLIAAEEKKLKKFLYKIIDTDTSYLQSYALEILTKFTDADNVAYLLDKLHMAEATKDKSTIDLLLKTLYPQYVSLVDVIDIIISYRNSVSNNASYEFPFDYELQDIIDKLHDENILQAVLNRLSHHLKDEKLCELYEIFLIRLINVCENLNTIANYVFILCDFEYHNYRYEKTRTSDIKQAVDNRQGLNHVIISRAVEKCSSIPYDHSGGYVYWFDVSSQYYTIDDGCAHICLENLEKVTNQDMRARLFYYAKTQWEKTSLAYAESQLTPYIVQNPDLEMLLKESKRQESYQESEFDKTIKNEELKFEQKRAQKIKAITKDLEHLKSLDEKGVQILWTIVSDIDGFNEELNIDKLFHNYEENISNVFLESIQRYWQITDINLDDFLEILCTNRILVKSLVCIMGISLFVKENPNAEFNKDLSRKMVYYGLQTLNSVPDYVISCAKKHPDVFMEIMVPCIDKIAISDTEDNSVLWKLKKFPAELLNLLEPVLLRALIKYPTNPNCYQIAKVVSKMEMNETKKRLFIRYIISKINNIRNENIYNWLILLYQLSPKTFVDRIKLLETKYTKKPEALYQFFEHLFAKLSEQDSTNIDIETLIDLVQMVYKYIQLKQDIHRENMGIFTPTNRDNAQHFRSHLLNLLSDRYLSHKDIPALHNLAKSFDSIEPKIANYLRSNADKLLLKDENAIWQENRVVKFEYEDYIDPTNADELFNICLNKLIDIKEDIETSDYSIKELYKHLKVRQNSDTKEKLTKETYFQKYVLMEMRRVSNKLYSAVREPEVANNKKPDLQIWNKNWCINIECKIVDNWSFKKLKEAIDEQLVRKYLKYPKYQHGILLLARIDRVKWGKNIFDDLISLLQQHANNIISSGQYSHIKAIKVIGIDYK